MSGPTIAGALSAADAASRAPALAALAQRVRDRGPAAIDEHIARALLVPLGSSNRTEQRHTADLLAPLAESVPALAAVLREALSSPDARLRWGAAYTIGRTRATRELWPSALETMRLEDGDQRWAAAELACRIVRDDPSMRAAIRGALADPSPTLRKMVLYCLRDLGDPGTAEAALELLADADSGVRLAALAALTAAGLDQRQAAATAGHVAALLTADHDAGVRRAAAVALGKLGAADPEIVAALRSATRSTDASLARAAAGALRSLGHPG